MSKPHLFDADGVHIAVLGAGALGSLYGARLAEAGCAVSLLSRREDYRRAVREQGLALEDASGVRHIQGFHVAASLAEVPPPALLLILVKGPDTEAAMAAASPAIPPDCLVLTLQNGLGNVEIIEKYAPRANLLAGISYNGATYLGPGRVRHAGNGETVIGELDGAVSPRLASLQRLLQRAGFPCSVSANINGLIWSKLLVNVCVNPLAALTRLRNGRLIEHPESLELMRRLLDEALAVAGKAGARLEVQDPLENLFKVVQATAQNRASMLQDVLAGKRTEIDSLNGAIVRLGRELGVPAPLHETIARLVRLLEKSFPEPE